MPKNNSMSRSRLLNPFSGDSKLKPRDGDKVLVDATDFFLHDAHGVAERLQEAKQGSYHLDAGRSAISMESTKNFPLNTEVESVLTFTTDGPLKSAARRLRHS